MNSYKHMDMHFENTFILRSHFSEIAYELMKLVKRNKNRVNFQIGVKLSTTNHFKKIIFYSTEKQQQCKKKVHYLAILKNLKKKS